MSGNTSLPTEGYVTLKQIMKVIPVGKTRWYEGVREGIFPKPVKFGRMSFYPVEAIRELIAKIGEGIRE